MRYLLVRVENFPRFDGESLSAIPFMGYAKSGKPPHEMHNFSVASDGYIYGHLPRNGGGDLTRLGGSQADAEISDVSVIFISKGVLCGYYTNATIFSQPIKHPDNFKAGTSEIYCRARVQPSCAVLIPPCKRKNRLQPQPVGTFPVFYGNETSEWVVWFKGLLAGLQQAFPNEKKRRKWTKTVERCSEARARALQEYGLKCECCKISHDDNVRSSVFEVHHKVPYAENFKTRPLDVSDLAVLCANCHRMIHRMPDVADVKALVSYLG